MIEFCGCDDGMCAICAAPTMTGVPWLSGSYLVLPGGAKVNADEVLPLSVGESLRFLANLGVKFELTDEFAQAMERARLNYRNAKSWP